MAIPTPSLGEQVGLGQAWNPLIPVAWEWLTLHAGDGSKGHLLKIHFAAGTIGFMLDDDSLGALLQQIQERHSGLTIARGLPAT